MPAAAPPPKPDSAVVVAYKRRKRIPFWAMLALALLPLWAFMYARAVTTQAEAADGPLAVGNRDLRRVPAATAGAARAASAARSPTARCCMTFPHIEDQLRFVYYGSRATRRRASTTTAIPIARAARTSCGRSTERRCPPRAATSPTPRSSASCATSATTSAGVSPAATWPTEFEEWCSEESEIFADLEAGGDIRTLEQRFPDIIPIGNEPVPGSPPGEPASE